MHEKLENQISDGERWLDLLGYSHLKGQPTDFEIDGRPALVEEFDQLCGEHAGKIFAGLESLDKADPRYNAYLSVAQKAFQSYFGEVEPQEG
jgi:hypothetical protein